MDSPPFNVIFGLAVLLLLFGGPIFGWIWWSRAQNRSYNEKLNILAERFGLSPVSGQNLKSEWLQVEGTYRGFPLLIGGEVEPHLYPNSATGVTMGAKMIVPESTVESLTIAKNHRINRLTLAIKKIDSGNSVADQAALFLCSAPEIVPALFCGEQAGRVSRLWLKGGTYRALTLAEEKLCFNESAYFRPKLDVEIFINAVELMAGIAEHIRPPNRQ